jgi:membrane-associated phospholipid phosphatase
MPVTALDRAIPFQSAALVVYFSLWLYVSLAPTLLRNRQELFAYGKIAAVMGLVGLGIFFFWPTTVPTGAGLGEANAAALEWLKHVDAAGNACPSLHVAFAVFSGFWLDRVIREMRLPLAVRVLNVAWCLGIAYSTLSTKQHVLVDVVAGGLLGLIAGAIRLRSPAEVRMSGCQTE